ncbi:type IV secretion system protein [Serratia fonticola]|uniref:type IV secretion system protein n=1 Tax=Serratia fonticola TaxID=47917 RepID=UPI00301C5FC3
MKHTTLSAAFIAGALLSLSLTARAGIPVMVDADPLRQVQWAQDAQNWLKTVQHYQSQIEAYKSQLATATGVRNIQDFLTQAKGLSTDLKNLQKNGISLNDLLTNGGGTYNNELKSLYNKYKMFDTCDTPQTQSYTDTCKQMVINKAVALEDTTTVQQKVSSTVNDIASLASRVEMSQDAKESQDLANAITAKSVQLNALTTQWEMGVKQSELRDQLLTTQRQKAFRQQQLNAPVADLNNL